MPNPEKMTYIQLMDLQVLLSRLSHQAHAFETSRAIQIVKDVVFFQMEEAYKELYLKRKREND